LDEDGTRFVNALFDYYIPNNTQHGVIEKTYARYADLAKKRLSEDLPDSAKAKWKWFGNFVKDESPHGLEWGKAY
jgi:hypothetical protein